MQYNNCNQHTYHTGGAMLSALIHRFIQLQNNPRKYIFSFIIHR